MKRFLFHIVGLSLVVYFGLPYFVHGINVREAQAAIIAAVLFAFINFAIKPVLRVITLPFNLLSFGLFGLLINVLLFWFVASVITGLEVQTLTAAFWGAITMTVANWVLDKVSR